jgi:hypothetical protein
MSKTKVLLVGAAGETGGSIANGLLEDGSFVRHLTHSIHLSIFTNPGALLCRR